MKIKVPFVKNLKKWKGNGWCGPLALACILRYYNNKSSIESIVKQAKTSSKGGTTPHGLINFCLKEKLGVSYYSKSKYENKNNRRYSKRHREFLKLIDPKMKDKEFWKLNKKDKKFRYIPQQGSIKIIEKFLRQKMPVLIIHNVAVIFRKDKFWPHYIAIVGYDKENFYIHNHACGNHKYQKVSKKLLNKSWSGDGFDGNIIIPYKK